MRKLIVSNLISLDGYASGPGGDVMALPFDTTFSDYNLEVMQAADTLVSGATTYRGFLSYWPPIADDPAQPEVERAISRRHRELEHLVVSNSLTAEETGPWRENTRIVRRDEGTGRGRPGQRGRGRHAIGFREHDDLERSARRTPGRRAPRDGRRRRPNRWYPGLLGSARSAAADRRTAARRLQHRVAPVLAGVTATQRIHTDDHPLNLVCAQRLERGACPVMPLTLGRIAHI